MILGYLVLTADLTGENIGQSRLVRYLMSDISAYVPNPNIRISISIRRLLYGFCIPALFRLLLL